MAGDYEALTIGSVSSSTSSMSASNVVSSFAKSSSDSGSASEARGRTHSGFLFEADLDPEAGKRCQNTLARGEG